MGWFKKRTKGVPDALSGFKQVELRLSDGGEIQFHGPVRPQVPYGADAEYQCSFANGTHKDPADFGRCQCGFYALRSRIRVRDGQFSGGESYTQAPTAHVNLYGTVVESSYGFRGTNIVVTQVEVSPDCGVLECSDRTAGFRVTDPVPGSGSGWQLLTACDRHMMSDGGTMLTVDEVGSRLGVPVSPVSHPWWTRTGLQTRPKWYGSPWLRVWSGVGQVVATVGRSQLLLLGMLLVAAPAFVLLMSASRVLLLPFAAGWAAFVAMVVAAAWPLRRVGFDMFRSDIRRFDRNVNAVSQLSGVTVALVLAVGGVLTMFGVYITSHSVLVTNPAGFKRVEAGLRAGVSSDHVEVRGVDGVLVATSYDDDACVVGWVPVASQDVSGEMVSVVVRDTHAHCSPDKMASRFVFAAS